MKNLLWIAFLLLFAAPLAAQTAAPDSLSTKVPEGFVLVKGGTFQMGDVMGDSEGYGQMKHMVTVSDFFLAPHELTFNEYNAYCTATERSKPSNQRSASGQHPVCNVSWYDAVEYCNWRSQQEGRIPAYTISANQRDTCNISIYDTLKWVVTLNKGANGYRLPTEAEWEYAAREGGKKVRFGNGRDLIDPAEINFNADSNQRRPYSIVGQFSRETVPASGLMANALGLKNMSGNVWEWCWDWYDEHFYSRSHGALDPQGPKMGSDRVLRGGSRVSPPQVCRTFHRSQIPPAIRGSNTGFRLAASL